MKKILILPIGFILIHVLYIGCCKCVEGNFHRELSSTRALEYSHSGQDVKDTVKVMDTFFASIQFNYTLIAKRTVNPMAQFVNAAYATRCNCGNYTDSGYRYKIDSLVITSNNDFKGISAGQNISSFFKTGYAAYYNGSTTISYPTVPQLIDSLNANPHYDNINLFTQPGNMPAKAHRFKYIIYSNGRSYAAESGKLVLWQ
ncbi:hypothetical protein [Ferruginibacter sp.]